MTQVKPLHSRLTRGAMRRGLGLVEAVVSLSICSMLLVAAGSAFVVSASAVQMNSDFFHASQTARVTLNQMLVEVRRADSVQCDAAGSTFFDVIRPTATLTPNEVYRRYAFDATNKQLTLQIFYTGGISGSPCILAHNLELASFGPPQMGTDSNNATVLQRLPVSLTVSIGSNHITLSGAAAPRRAMRY